MPERRLHCKRWQATTSRPAGQASLFSLWPDICWVAPRGVNSDASRSGVGRRPRTCHGPVNHLDTRSWLAGRTIDDQSFITRP